MYFHWLSSLFLISVSILPFSSWLFSFLIITYHFYRSNSLVISVRLQICGGIHHFHQVKVCPTGQPCCSAMKLGCIPFHLHSKLDFSQAGSKITNNVPYFGFAGIIMRCSTEIDYKYIPHCSLYTVIEKNRNRKQNTMLI